MFAKNLFWKPAKRSIQFTSINAGGYLKDGRYGTRSESCRGFYYIFSVSYKVMIIHEVYHSAYEGMRIRYEKDLERAFTCDRS